MMLILVILHLSQSFIHAAPTSLLDSDSTSTVAHLQSSTQPSSAGQQRSIWDILWSCLATIIACSWVSVHPNIPPLNEKWWMAPLRRLELMMWAILAPEVIILWAMRQWIGARKLAREYQARGWTKTHGYFLQMGGFALFKGEDFQGFLYAGFDTGGPGDKHVDDLAVEKFPKIIEKEIQDRSKGDGLSKALAISQTFWFVTQCMARRIEGLYITELELATAAFAVLNGVMYFLWWNKPLNVQCPVPIQLLDTPGEQSPNSGVTTQTKPIHSTTPLLTILYRLAEIGDLKDTDARPGTTFYASTLSSEDGLAMKWASVAAIIFGGIHCAAWAFTFPSHAELVIWRVCSIVITTVPLIIIVYVRVVKDIYPTGSEGPVKTLTIASIPLYIIARVLLLAEAFTTLRDLPSGAYEAVRWVTFIPHI